ncbi:hypothetical protein RRG08_013068 [Elysia crispata]|uniref:Uncharacterized protein n=1 Tax=Elysia crispata TaxID=231223 RepID=A0AAE1DQQ1_9GAST|nr:hypothetical protein RRG08_013068 [Elysia crispata]
MDIVREGGQWAVAYGHGGHVIHESLRAVIKMTRTSPARYPLRYGDLVMCKLAINRTSSSEPAVIASHSTKPSAFQSLPSHTHPHTKSSYYLLHLKTLYPDGPSMRPSQPSSVLCTVLRSMSFSSFFSLSSFPSQSPV